MSSSAQGRRKVVERFAGCDCDLTLPSRERCTRTWMRCDGRIRAWQAERVRQGVAAADDTATGGSNG